MALDPVTAALGLGTKIVEHFFPDPTQQAAAKLELLKLAQQGDLAAMTAQTDINKVEAASANLFVSGWRPAVGWVCVLGLFSQFLVQPFATWLAALSGHPIVFPSLDMGTLMVLLTGMLGFGAARTIEKLQDAAGNH